MTGTLCGITEQLFANLDVLSMNRKNKSNKG